MRILYTVYRIQYTVQYTEQIVSVVDWHVWKKMWVYTGTHERPLQSWIRAPVCRAYDTRRGLVYSRATSKTAT